ncbi:MAG: hypothetical protein LRY43_02185 [Gammaproteobacteria bacterium]|nr:hypothetical protein [Gammaproteobacteria bacterium]
MIHNFIQAVDLLKASDAIDIVDNDAMSLGTALCVLAKNPNLRAAKGERALKVVDANRGAVNKQFALIQQILTKGRKIINTSDSRLLILTKYSSKAASSRERFSIYYDYLKKT